MRKHRWRGQAKQTCLYCTWERQRRRDYFGKALSGWEYRRRDADVFFCKRSSVPPCGERAEAVS